MANRTTKVSLVAEVSGYVAGLDKAAKKTRELGTEAEKLAQKKDAIQALGVGLLAIGTVAAVGVGMAVKKFAEFDQAISNVKAATQETTENMGLLRGAALEAGASTVFSATEAANAIEELGKAGLTTADILSGGLDSALSLASAGQLGVAEAAQIAAVTMKQFKLSSADLPHVADLLAAGAGKAVGSVQEMSDALGQVGLVANGAGLSVEETTGTLAAFADQGLLGSDAGTSFKTMLGGLTPNSAKAADEIKRLGLSAFDASGEFIGMEAFAGKLRTGLSGLTAEQRATSLEIIYGQDAVRAGRAIYDLGAEGIRKYIKQTDDSGYAAKVAADRLDNLRGDVEKLGGSFDTALIKSGSGANDVLRGLTQSATVLIDGIGSLPEPVLNAGLALGAVVAATALVGGGALIAVPKITAFKGSLDLMGISAGKAAAGLGIASGAIAVATIGLGIWVSEQAKASAKVDEYAESLDKATRKATAYTREIAKSNLATKGFLGSDSAYDAAEKIGLGLEVVTDAATGSAPALEAVRAKLAEIEAMDGGEKEAAFGKNWVLAEASAKRVEDAVKGESNSLVEAIRVAKQKALVDEKAVKNGETLADTQVRVAEEIEAVTAAQDEWVKMVSDSDAAFVNIEGALDTLIQKNQETAQATADATDSSSDSWEDYYDGFSFALADYLTELQTMVDAQNNWETNMVLLSGKVSEGVLAELEAMGPEGAPLVAALVNGSAEELAKAEELFAEKADAATGAFATRLYESQIVINAAAGQLGQDAANEIAGKLAAGTSTVEQIIKDYGLKIESLNPVVQIDTSTAAGKIEALLARLRLSQEIAAGAGYVRGDGVEPPGKADGGAILGAGGPRADSILIRASNGEHMLDAEDVRRMGGQSGVYAFRNSLYGFADGGAIGNYSRPRDVQYERSGGSMGGASAGRGAVNSSVSVTMLGSDAHEVASVVSNKQNWEWRRRE